MVTAAGRPSWEQCEISSHIRKALKAYGWICCLRCTVGSQYSGAMSDPGRIGIRIHLTIPQEVVDVLDRLGDLTGDRRATIIRAWLVEGLPHMAAVADALELAERSPEQALKSMGQTLGAALTEGEQLQLEMKRDRRRLRRRERGRPT